MTTTTIGVLGMTCSGCVNSVTKALKGVAGVEDVSVCLEEHRATVSFDERQTSVASLKEAVEEAGYDTN